MRNGNLRMSIYKLLLHKAINLSLFSSRECGSVDISGTAVIADGSFGKESCVRLNMMEPMSLRIYTIGCDWWGDWAYSVALEESLSLDSLDDPELVVKPVGEVDVESASVNIFDSVIWDELSPEEAKEFAWYGRRLSRCDTDTASYCHIRTGSDMTVSVFALYKDDKPIGVLIDGTSDEDSSECIAEFEDAEEPTEGAVRKLTMDDLDDFIQSLSETELWELAEKILKRLRASSMKS